MKSFKTLAAMSLVTLPLMGASVDALAVDAKYYSGAHCVPTSPGTTTGWSRNEATGVTNNGTVVRSFLCPLVRDIAAAQTGGISDARVRYVDNTSEGDVACTVSSYSNDGLDVRTSRKSSPVGGLPAVQELDFPAVDTFSSGYFTLNCAIPKVGTVGSQGPSSVISYSVSEKE